MRIEDMILISVDDHVVEPPDMFDNHLPEKYKEHAPFVRTNDFGHDVWVYEGQEIPNIGLNAVAGKPPEEWGFEPTKFSEIRDGCYKVDKRIQDMNLNGVLGSLCFPSFPQFCGQLFSRSQDKEIGLAMVRAYNDWHIDEWCGSYPDRLIPLSIPPIWDPQLMADEVRRVAKKGCHTVTFSENPAKLGWPSWHSDAWDPFFKACDETGTVILLHIGSSSQLVVTADDAPIDVLVTLQPMNTVQAAADILWSPVFRKFSNLQIMLSEGGTGWIPYFLERADYVYQKHSPWTGQDLGGRLPSQIFREHVTYCFIDDRVGIELRDRMGVDRITWECDYPHSDSSWPQSPELVSKQLDGVPDDEINMITHENAMRMLQFDPYSIRPREKCTVGALRAEATDVDPIRESTGERRKTDGPVTITGLTERIASMSEED
jgi:predicted TIM-barrel fold metal-dependent hydrolase